MKKILLIVLTIVLVLAYSTACNNDSGGDDDGGGLGNIVISVEGESEDEDESDSSGDVDEEGFTEEPDLPNGYDDDPNLGGDDPNLGDDPGDDTPSVPSNWPKEIPFYADGEIYYIGAPLSGKARNEIEINIINTSQAAIDEYADLVARTTDWVLTWSAQGGYGFERGNREFGIFPYSAYISFRLIDKE